MLVIAAQLMTGAQSFSAPNQFAGQGFSSYHCSVCADNASSLKMVSTLNSNVKKTSRVRRFLSITNIFKRKASVNVDRGSMNNNLYKNSVEVDNAPEALSMSSQVDINTLQNAQSVGESVPSESQEVLASSVQKINVQLPPAFDLPSQSGRVVEEMENTADMVETNLGRIAMIASLFLFYSEITTGTSFPDQMGF